MNIRIKSEEYVIDSVLVSLSISYSSDVILMFRLTYQHTVYNLLFRRYSDVQTNVSAHCL
jgi:hypothetical protein